MKKEQKLRNNKYNIQKIKSEIEAKEHNVLNI